MKYSDVFKNALTRLEGMGHEEAEADAWELMESVTGFDRANWLVKREEEMPEEQRQQFIHGVMRLLKNEPISYITGYRWFMGLKFKVNPATLIPRQDTEILCETVLDDVRKKVELGMFGRSRPINLLDMCTGSGCIAISLVHYIEEMKTECRCLATDISDDALKAATSNAVLNRIGLELIKSDMFSELDGRIFDYIVSNPPYIPRDMIPLLDEKVSAYEPITALDGGADGLDYYRILAANAGNHLKSGGSLYMEIGYNQGVAAGRLFKAAGFENVRVIKDYNGLDRVIACEKP